MREGVIRSFTIKCTIIKNDDDHDFEPNFYFPVDIFENVNGEKAPSERKRRGKIYLACGWSYYDENNLWCFYYVVEMQGYHPGIDELARGSRQVKRARRSSHSFATIN